MTPEIHTQSLSYGQSSGLADTLVIEISATMLQFCELQSETNCPVYICAFPFDNAVNKGVSEQLVMAINHFGFSKKVYKTVLVNEVSSRFTLCPTSFYEPDTTRTLLEFNCGDIENDLVLTDEINASIKLVYSVSESIKSVLDKLFPQHKLKHNNTVLARLMLNSEELSKENMLIYIREHTIEIIVKQQQQLLLVNQYSIKTNEDVLYYILFIFEQYQLNPLSALLTVIGNIETNSELIVHHDFALLPD